MVHVFCNGLTEIIQTVTLSQSVHLLFFVLQRYVEIVVVMC